MSDRFDRRILDDQTLELVRACLRVSPGRLGGGVALGAADLGHRLSNDIDLMFSHPAEMRIVAAQLAAIGRGVGATVVTVRDAGHLVRARAEMGGRLIEVDLVQDDVPRIVPEGRVVEGVPVESLADLRAAKLTCVLSRSEPRDLVDLLFLERAGYPPEDDLEAALTKDAGIDPAVLAWLLGQFPTRPLPTMLLPLTEAELLLYRNELRDRFRRLALPE